MRHNCSLTFALIGLIVFTFATAARCQTPATQPATTAPALDGAIIEMKVTMEFGNTKIPPQTVRITMKIKGANMRVDVGDMMTTLYLKDGRQVMLTPAMKTMTYTSLSDLKAGYERTVGNKAPKPESTTFKPTGERQQINGVDAEAFISETSLGGKVQASKCWIVANYPDAESILDLQRYFAEHNKGGKYVTQFQAEAWSRDIPKGSFSVRSEQEVPGSGRSITEMSARLAAIDDSQFEVPVDYKETKLPAAPTGR